MTRPPGDTTYTKPRIEDHGSLAELTADFDLNFVGSVAKTLTFAVASAPMPGGGGGEVSMTNPPPGVDTMPGGGGLPDIPGTDIPDSVTPGGGGGTRGVTETASGGHFPSEGFGTGPGGGSGSGGTLPASEAGRLPFTGYVAWSYAAAGAAMTTAGITLRRMLRRGN